MTWVTSLTQGTRASPGHWLRSSAQVTVNLLHNTIHHRPWAIQWWYIVLIATKGLVTVRNTSPESLALTTSVSEATPGLVSVRRASGERSKAMWLMVLLTQDEAVTQDSLTRLSGPSASISSTTKGAAGQGGYNTHHNIHNPQTLCKLFNL